MAGTNVGTAYLEVIPSAQGFAGKLQSEVGGDVAKSGAAAGKSYGTGFAKTAKSVMASALVATVATGAIKFAADALAEARDAQKVGALTSQVIKTTGGAANVTAKQVGDLAGAISSKVGIDDEAIQSGANLLLTFKNIRNETGAGNDMFNRATKAAVDLGAGMAAASGGAINMRSASTLVGKALNDPLKGMTALTRVGITFTDSQKKQVQSLVASGDAMGAQKIILKELNSQFGGAAQSQATAADKVAVSWGNLKESVGTQLLPVVDRFLNTLNSSVIPALSNFGNWASRNSGTLRALAVTVVTVGAALAVFGTVAMVRAAGGLAAYVLQTNIAARATRAFAGAQAVMNAVMALNPFVLVIAGLALLGAALVLAYKKSSTFRAVVQGAFSGVRTAIAWVIDAAANLMGTFARMLRGLSKVPGFGWAKTAASAMGNAAGKAHQLAANIRGIQSRSVTVTTTYRYIETGKPSKSQSLIMNGAVSGARAAGGPVAGGRTYLVGEEGPELFTPNASGRITPNHDLNAAPSALGSGAAGGRMTLVVDGHEFSAYVDSRADSRVGAARASAARRTRARLEVL